MNDMLRVKALKSMVRSSKRSVKTISVLLTLALLLFLCGCAGVSSANKEEAVLATGGTAGTYFAVGSAMSTVLNPVLNRSELSVLSTGGSRANIALLDSREASFAIVQNDVLYYAYTATDLFEGDTAHERLRGLACLYEETLQIVTCDESIKTVADLKGKTVCVGDEGSGVEVNARQILEAYGMTFDDINVVNAPFADAAESLKSGEIDAAFIIAGAPTKAVTDLAESQSIRLVALDGKHISALQSKYRFYAETVLTAGTYKGLDEDVTTVSVKAVLAASDRLSSEKVYELLSAFFEKNEQISTSHKGLQGLTPEMASEGISVPLHKGAEKYYKEKGIALD